MPCILVKNLPAIWGTWVPSLGGEDPLEEGMATHSSILARRIPWTREPGGLQSMGSQRVGHDLATKQEQIIAADISLGVYVDSNVVGWYFQPPPL